MDIIFASSLKFCFCMDFNSFDAVMMFDFLYLEDLM